MHILVCSKVSIPATDRTLPAWKYLRAMGHTVTVAHPRRCPNPPDVIISMGVTVMAETFTALNKFPGVPLFCYNWDCYEWVWTNPRPGEYNYKRYGELLKLATEIWVPSNCTGERTTQWWGLDNWCSILSSIPYWEHDNVRDGGYALCTLREIPDPQWDWFERACKELGIPYKMTMHERSYEEYQDAVAGCRFLVSHCHELSTGGLTLLEGYYLGKACLLNDSKWHGGKDYLQNRAAYFNSESFEDFKRQLSAMYVYCPKVSPDHKEYVTENFSDRDMINSMLERITAYV